jgi:hypothetical protein
MAAAQGSIHRERCIELRTQGYSLRLIARETGLSQTAVRYHVRGIDVEKPLNVIQREAGTSATRLCQPLPPSEDLAYLIGVISGDGCLYVMPRTCQLIISCDARYPDLIEDEFC